MVVLVRCVGVIAFGALVLLGAPATIPSAIAGDLHADKAGKSDSPSTAIDASVPQTEKAPVDPSADAASAAADLDSTRSAIDRRTGIPITLSVSGWVGEQVISGH
jgi:hypothetical protein